MQYGIAIPKIISDPRKSESVRKVQDGIIKSAMLTSEQRRDIHGLIQSAIPGADIHSRAEHKPESEPRLKKVKPSKTPLTIGSRHYPGSSKP